MPQPVIRRKREGKDIWKISLCAQDEDLSRLWVILKRMRIGSATVRIGGIGGVWTHKAHRMNGYASRVMHESTALMADCKCDLGFLFGIQNFYHRFGYGVVLPDPTLHLKTESLLKARRILPTRAMRRADAPEVARLYNRLNAGHTGVVVRPRDWRYFDISAHFRKPDRAVLVMDGRHRITGYATCAVRDEQLMVSELDGADGAAFETLAAVLGRRARQAGAETVECHLPQDHLFGAFCVRYGCGWRVQCTRNGGAMARIIHLASFMEKLSPELGRRLNAAAIPWQGALSLETDIGSVNLHINGPSVTVTPDAGSKALKVSIPQMALTQLAMGYRSVSDVAYDAEVNIPSRALPVLDALFPRGYPYMCWADRF